MAATASASAPASRKKGPARPSGCISTCCVRMTTGVLPFTMASGSATNAVRPSRPLCSLPASRALGSRSPGPRPSGRSVSPACAAWFPRRGAMPSWISPVGVTCTTLTSAARRVLATIDRRFRPTRRSAADWSAVGLSDRNADKRSTESLTVGASSRRSLSAESVAVCRNNPAVPAALRTSTPNAIPSMATKRRVPRRRVGGFNAGCPGSVSRLQPVPDPAHGLDIDGVAELLAHLCDVHVDRAGVAVPVVTPHAVEDLLAGQREAGALGEVAQQVELLRRELDGLARDAHLAPAGVDRHRTQLHDLGRGAAVDAPQHRFHPGDELGGRERLRHVVVAAELQAEHPIDFAVAGGEEDDRDL